MDCSPPGLPVHHQLLEFAQTHVHWIGDAIQLSHPLSSPSPRAVNLSQHQGLFKWVSSLRQVVKRLEFQLQHQSFQWIFRTDLLYDGLVWSPWCPRGSQESPPTRQFKSYENHSYIFKCKLMMVISLQPGIISGSPWNCNLESHPWDGRTTHDPFPIGTPDCC